MTKKKLSTEEIALGAARDVATIMHPRLEDADEEIFVETFAKKAIELLEEKGDVFLGLIAYEDNVDFITKETSDIFQFINENIQLGYTFRNGRMLIYFNKEEGTGIWEGD